MKKKKVPTRLLYEAYKRGRISKRKFVTAILEYRRMLKEQGVHPKDDLLRGITYEELITTIQSNVPVEELNADTIEREFNTIVNANLVDAVSELRQNVDWIIGQVR